ncbi:MAG: hypothetical protein IPL61_26985 [Myxococcales bacterium]|nr:hypothetical protein [Myxococcales bacterium]
MRTSSSGLGLAAIVVAGCASTPPRPTGTYCFSCAGVNQVTFAFTPTPADPELASLEVTFVECPTEPTTMPLSFEGFVVKAVPAAEHPDADTGFAAGELHIEQCSMDHLRAQLWLQREDGRRIEHTVDIPLTVTSPPR